MREIWSPHATALSLYLSATNALEQEYIVDTFFSCAATDEVSEAGGEPHEKTVPSLFRAAKAVCVEYILTTFDASSV